MLRTCLIICFTCLLTSTVRSQAVLDIASANEAITNQDFTLTVTILDSLEASGVVDDKLYLALGNAHFETGKPGRAILAYERGLRLAPGSADLKNNLRYVREESGIPVTEVPTFFLLRWWTVTGAALGSTSAYSISIIFWWLAIGGMLWWFIHRRRMGEKKRFALLPLSITAAVLAVVFLFVGQSRHAYLSRSDEAILLKAATLRVSPSAEGSVEAELAEGEKLLITDRVNRFVKVRMEDGRQGYVSKADVEGI